MRTMILMGLLAVAGCRVAIPSSNKLSDAKIGPPPTLDLAVQQATDSLRAQLPYTDVDRVAFDSISKGFYAVGIGARYQRFAWQLIASVDAKNSHGLREGARPYHFYFLGDRLVATASPATSWDGREYQEHYAIAEVGGGGLTTEQAGLQPFPESDPFHGGADSGK